MLATDRGEVGEWWIHAEPASTCAVELLAPDGRVLLTSATVRTPRDSESPRSDVRWVERERQRREHEAAAARRRPGSAAGGGEAGGDEGREREGGGRPGYRPAGSSWPGGGWL